MMKDSWLVRAGAVCCLLAGATADIAVTYMVNTGAERGAISPYVDGSDFLHVAADWRR
jgi:hypothetical protein